MALGSRMLTAGSRTPAQTRQSDVRPSRAHAVLCGDAAWSHCRVTHLAANSATRKTRSTASAHGGWHQPGRRRLHALDVLTVCTLILRL